MFIKLPSGRIFQINLILECNWVDDELHVFSSADSENEYWVLRDEDAKRLYEYLESIAFT